MIKELWSELNEYIKLKSSGWLRYLIEELFNSFLGWIPGMVGISLRWIFYRLIISGRGWIAIERGVEIFGSKWLEIGRGVYIGEKVFLQARPAGMKIGSRTRIMPQAHLNVYNFRGLAQSKIEIGEDCVIGIGSVITGQGGVKIGNKVIIAPAVKILAVQHNYDNPDLAIKDQGISAKGIVIKDNVWIGAGAIILDGITIGKNSVIGAGAVVVDDVPDYTVVAGNPAQVIKKIKSEIEV